MNIRERLSTIHRNLVVSYDLGERLGHVTNVYFEKSTCSIKGLSVSSKLIKSDGELFVNFEAIHRLGESVVIISTKDELKKFPRKVAGSSLRDLKGTKIVTEDGEHLGELLDVNVFAKSGIISDLVLYGPKKLKIDVKKDTISIGPDMIIVPASYRNRIVDIEPPKPTGLAASADKKRKSIAETIKKALLGTPTKQAKKKPQAPQKKAILPLTSPAAKSSPAPAAKKTVAAPTKKSPAKKAAKKAPAKKAPAKKAPAKK